MNETPRLGVIVVSYNSAEIIAECLESLFASMGVILYVVVVDNHSTDDTVRTIEKWSDGTAGYVHPAGSPLPDQTRVAKPIALARPTVNTSGAIAPGLTLLSTSMNSGFAGAVNHGLRALLATPEVDLFWILNPDCVVPPETARQFCNAASVASDFALIGGRIVYYDHPGIIQTDGGRVDRHTAACRQLGRDADPATEPLPDASTLDFITGASMVASRSFVEQVGLMVEDYFLFYEEIDWAFRRGDRPLVIAPGAWVYHRGGTSTGSGGIGKHASTLAFYFNYRNRVRFAHRFLQSATFGVYGFALVQAARLLLAGAIHEAWALVAGLFDLKPPRSVTLRIADPAAAHLAFAPRRRD